MSRQNTIADAMSALKNAGDCGKPECILEPEERRGLRQARMHP